MKAIIKTPRNNNRAMMTMIVIMMSMVKKALVCKNLTIKESMTIMMIMKI